MKDTRHHLASIVAERTLHITNKDELAKEIAAYLLHEKETSGLESLIRDVMQYRANKGHLEAVAVSVSPLTEQVLDDIELMLKKEYPNARNVVITEKRDPTLVGGLRVDMANEQLDMSVQSKLNTFKRLTALERN